MVWVFPGSVIARRERSDGRGAVSGANEYSWGAIYTLHHSSPLPYIHPSTPKNPNKKTADEA